MNRFFHIIRALAMLFIAGLLLYFYLSGRIDSYLAERFRILSLLGGLGLGVIAMFNLFMTRHAREEESCEHDEDHAHGHDENTLSGNIIALVVLLVPVVVAASYSQDRFVDIRTIQNKGVNEAPTTTKKPGRETDAKAGSGTEDDEWEYTLEDLEKVVDRSEEGNLLLTVDQLFYTSGDEELQNVLTDQPVETIGQVIPDKDNPDRLRVFRLMVTCCAADAQPVSVPVEFEKGTPEFKEMEWVKIVGTMKYPQEDGRTQAVIDVEKMEPTEEPVDYLMF